MFQLSKVNSSSMMGLDINCSAITLLELSGNQHNPRVEAYARESLPFAPVIDDVNALAQCIQTLLVKTPFAAKQVVLAIPDSLVISKMVQVHANLSTRAIEEFVLIKAEHYFPSMEEINLDFEIIGPCSKNPSMLDVLMVASKAQNLNIKVQAATKAGLTAKVVDVESYAIERAALLCIKALNQEIHLVVFIYLGLNLSQLLVFQDMELIFSKEEPFGEMQLLDSLATHFQMSLDKAREWVVNGCFSEEHNHFILNPFKLLLLMHIKRTLELFYTTTLKVLIQHVFLAGNLVRPLRLDVFIGQQLGLSTSFANPLVSMSLHTCVDESSIIYDAPALMTVCGLALRNVK